MNKKRTITSARATALFTVILLGGSIALAGPFTNSSLLKSLVTGTTPVGTACTAPNICDEISVYGGTGGYLNTIGSCMDMGTCCSMGLCWQNSDCCNLPSSCEQQLPSLTKECCTPTGSECQQESWAGSAPCCNNYIYGALSGESTYNGGLAEACLPNGGWYSCQTCKEDDSTHSVGNAPNGVTTVALSTCCTGFESNISGTNPGPAYCCSGGGQGCSGTVNGNHAFCCGSAQDPTLGTHAAFAQCSSTFDVCCYVDGANCAVDTDCCSGDCNPSTHACSPPQCQ
jgi:hypothetical protein